MEPRMILITVPDGYP